MRSFRITAPGKYEFTEQPVPDIAPDEVLLRIKMLGYCGSDLNTWRGFNPMVQYPRIIGHEISGIIEKTGAGVPAHIKAGLKATVVPYTTCGQCPSCKKGRTNACRNNKTLGVQRDGAFSEYLAVPWEKLILNDKLSHSQLVLVEPLSVGFHAVSRGKVGPGDTVLVLGCGMIGMGAVMAAAARGARVIAADIAPQKLEQAKAMGAGYLIRPDRQDMHAILEEITGGNGPDVVIEAIGLPQTFVQAVEEVAFSGTVVYIGYAKEPVTYQSKLFVQKELDIRGSRNALTEDFTEVVKVLEKGEMPVTTLITKKVPFAKAGEALKEWSDNPRSITKLVVDMEL